MAVQKSMDKRDLRWYAISSYASELQDSGKSRLSGDDIQSLIDYEKTEDQLNAMEQNILRRIYWRMHYHFDEFESDVEFVRQQLTNQVPPEENPFDFPDPAPIPDQSHIEEKFDESQFSTSQIESMLEFARFLYVAGFKLKDRDSALRFVAKLISSDFICQSTLDSLHADNHAEFNRLLDRCLQISFTESIADVEQRKSNTRRIIDGISKILLSNKISIPGDVDDFMLKLATLAEFRENIYSSLQDDSRAMLDLLCIALIENEKEDESNEKYRQNQSDVGCNEPIGIEQRDY